MRRLIAAVVLCVMLFLAGCADRPDGLEHLVTGGGKTDTGQTGIYTKCTDTPVGHMEKTVELPLLIRYGLYEFCIFNIPKDEIRTESDLEKVTSMRIYFGNPAEGVVFHIDELDVFDNLTELAIYDVNLDIRAIERLTGLEKLTLSNCGLQDITPVGRLENIEKLDLGMNRISDISVLCTLPHLRELILDRNRIEAVEDFAGMSVLEELCLDHNPVTDMTCLAQCRRLRRLSISGIIDEPGESFSGLELLNGLESLDISFNSHAGTAFLKSMPGLKELDISSCHIKTVEFPEESDITWLDISDNPLGDLKCIDGLKNLEYLKAGGCGAQSLDPIAGLKALRTLDISEDPLFDEYPNMFEDISAVTQIDGLTQLTISPGDVGKLRQIYGRTRTRAGVAEFFENDMLNIPELLGREDSKHHN